jgi:hypothetical protein
MLPHGQKFPSHRSVVKRDQTDSCPNAWATKVLIAQALILGVLGKLGIFHRQDYRNYGNPDS